MLVTLALTLATSLMTHAGFVTCRGRCVLLESSKAAGSDLTFIDELGLVEGADLKALAVDCQAMAAAKSIPDRRGYVVENLTVTPDGDRKVVKNYQTKSDCDHDVNSTPVSEQSIGVVAADLLKATFRMVAEFFASKGIYR